MKDGFGGFKGSAFGTVTSVAPTPQAPVRNDAMQQAIAKLMQGQRKKAVPAGAINNTWAMGPYINQRDN
jgi:hypothetical protein